jgi:hypothetical protein
MLLLNDTNNIHIGIVLDNSIHKKKHEHLQNKYIMPYSEQSVNDHQQGQYLPLTIVRGCERTLNETHISRPRW